MHFGRISQNAILVIAVALLGFGVSSCTNSECSLPRCAACPDFVVISPQVQDVYPMPGASEVPTNVGVVVYASTQKVPIALTSGATKLATHADGSAFAVAITLRGGSLGTRTLRGLCAGPFRGQQLRDCRFRDAVVGLYRPNDR